MEMQHIRAVGAAFTITLDRKAFVASLALQKRVVERRNTIPILSNVMLRVEGRDCLTMTGTDLDVQIAEEIPCDAPQPGAFTLNVYSLHETAKKMKGDMVKLQDMGAGQVALTDMATGSTVRLPALPATDFPIIARGDMLAEFELEPAAFAGTIATALPAVSTEETRYYLNGVYIHAYCESPRERTAEHEALADELAAQRAADRAEIDAIADAVPELADAVKAARQVAMLARAIRAAEIGERIDELEAERCQPDALRFAATDGHRLYCVSTALPDGGASMPPAIFPRKACGLVGHVAKHAKAALESHIAFSPSAFRIRTGRVTLTGKLIDGTFPDYTRVIPSYSTGRLDVASASAFRSAVEGVAAVCTEKTRAIKCSMTADYVTLFATSPEFGRSAATVDGASYRHADEGGAVDPLALGCNAKYLMAALDPFADGPVTLEIGDATGPFRFRSEAQPGLTVVLMPMRVGDGADVFSPGDVRALTASPIERLQEGAAEKAEAIAYMTAEIAKPENKAVRATLRRARTIQRKALGELVTGANDYFGQGVARHWTAKLALATALGDEAARRIAGEVLARLQAGPLGALTALREPDAVPVPQPAPEPVLPPEPAAVPVPQPEPETVDVVTPEPQPVAVQPEAEPIVDEAEREPVKIADVYGRVFYVDAGDYESDRPRCRRLHKNGAPFCDSEAKGGAWQTVLRENIARQILPRGTTEKPAKILRQPSAGDDGLAERVAKLEALVASLTGITPAEAEPAALETASESVESDELAALRGRVLELETENVALQGEVTKLARSRAWWTRNAIADRGARAARDTAKADHREAQRRAETAEAGWTEETRRADRLQVRCDALEAHAAASDRLDRAADPAGANGHIVLPPVPSRPRAETVAN